MSDASSVTSPLRGIPATLLIAVWGRALATEHSKIDLEDMEALVYRRRLIQDDERHRTIVGSIAKPEQWLQPIARKENFPLLVLAEGLLPFFSEEVVRALSVALINRFSQLEGYVEQLGDLAKGKVHPLVKAVGSQGAFQLGARDPATQVAGLHPKLGVMTQENLIQHQKQLWRLIG